MFSFKKFGNKNFGNSNKSFYRQNFLAAEV